jgi:uncharacterized protein DUF4864
MRDDHDSGSTNTVLIVLGVVVGALLLVGLVCAGLGFFAFRTASVAVQQAAQAAAAEDAADAEIQQAENVVQTFLESLKAGQVDGAYGSTTPAFRAKQTLEQFKAFVGQNPLLTKWADTESDDPNHQAGVARMTIPYTLNDNNNRALKVTFYLANDNGVWKVDGLTIP